jgi:hypothetical protein
MAQFQASMGGLGSIGLQQKVLVYKYLLKLDELRHSENHLYRSLRDTVMYRDTPKLDIYTGKLPNAGQYHHFVTEYLHALGLEAESRKIQGEDALTVNFGGSLKGRKTNKRKTKKRKTQRRRV